MLKRLAVEGTIAGTVGAAVVSGWFLVYDTAHGEPLRTPALLGAAFFQGLRDPDSLRVTSGLVLGYSVLHWAAFVAFGWIAAGLLAAADREPRLYAALLMLFCCLEVLAIATIAVLRERLFEALPQWTIVAGNLLAASAMIVTLLRAHLPAWHRFLAAVE